MLSEMISLLADFLSKGSLIPLAFAVIAVFFLMSSYRRKLRKRRQQPERDSPLREPPAADMQAPSPERRIRRDLESLMIELEELSRKISAQIDTRFAKLEAVIRDADRREEKEHKPNLPHGLCIDAPGPPPRAGKPGRCLGRRRRRQPSPPIR